MTLTAMPPTIAEEAIERGRVLFAQPCRFVASAGRLDQIPGDRLPEAAFAGRSNVGKSSLINALTGRTRLANISATPGRTRQLVFFNLADRLMLADLPGYGYAQAAKAQVAAWTRLVESYLVGRAPLRRVLLLIDGRHGPMANDEQVMRLLDRAAVSYQVVLTKCDKVADAELAERVRQTTRGLAAHTAAHPEVACSSALAGLGIPDLRAVLGELAAPRGEGGD